MMYQSEGLTLRRWMRVFSETVQWHRNIPKLLVWKLKQLVKTSSCLCNPKSHAFFFRTIERNQLKTRMFGCIASCLASPAAGCRACTEMCMKPTWKYFFSKNESLTLNFARTAQKSCWGHRKRVKGIRPFPQTLHPNKQSNPGIEGLWGAFCLHRFEAGQGQERPGQNDVWSAGQTATLHLSAGDEYFSTAGSVLLEEANFCMSLSALQTRRLNSNLFFFQLIAF